MYGILQPFIMPWLSAGSISKVKVDDFQVLSSVPYYQMAMVFSVTLGVLVGLFENFMPWASLFELPGGLEPWRQAWPPSLR